ncbi:YegS/Rv2252/BmrU family lipid kinase [Georgenia soli]|uniref:YegS/Rv2252/BmrU family lipid kinase n=1 Tax=Georgenia soli TaxID=638953 RepID=A0A2A9EK93_9MICO|nr:diacylglycerol kinase family protein [Georgenia soli]PFG38951.1 YegS/Rv2252/BmrU family lipid kinase [Georgenia soli]
MPGSRSLLVLANAAAGSADDAAVAAALGVLRAGAEIEVVVPDGPEDTLEAVSRAAGREIVVLGGDGSVHGCLDALVRLRLLVEAGPVSVVPLGTGNDLARGLGLPQDPEEAALVALQGVPRPMDLLRDDVGGVVVNVVHAGVGAEATAGAENVKGPLGTAGYAIGAIRAGVSATGWCMRVMVDGEVVHDGGERLLMVTVGLGPTIGGGARAVPQATIGNGMADVVLSAATGPLARAAFALQLRRGHHLRRKDVRAVRGRTVTIEAVDGDNAFRVNADGEVAGPVTSRTWEVLPHAWSCRVPAAAGLTAGR